MKKFATDAMPLHASGLPGFMECLAREVAKMIAVQQYEEKRAADTGSLVHEGIAVWHTLAKGDARVAVRALRGALEKFPAGDLARAEDLFLRYAEDPRNKEAQVILVEKQVKLRWKAAPTDPTQEEVVIWGTLDQARIVDGLKIVLDAKTGVWLKGGDMINHHAYQLAAYWLGAEEHVGRVDGCGIIRLEDYAKNGPVFWRMPWSRSQAMQLLDNVAWRVADVRAGRVMCNPGSHCKWCEFLNYANCVNEVPLLLKGQV